MTGGRRRGRAAVVGAALGGLVVAGCAYFNSLYNARRAFDEAQAARLRDRPAEAASAYRDAIDKAARSYRSDDAGRWADDALYIMGRAYYHSGEWARSESAMERLLEISSDSGLRAGARVHLGGVALATGRRDLGLRLLDDALEEVPDATLRAEAHLWRARAHFDAGRAREGWAGLRRLEEASGEVRVQAGLERIARGLEHDDFEQALAGATTVFAEGAGAAWADSVLAAVARASTLWGAGPAAAMLAPAERGGWGAAARDRARLERARLLARAGDAATATEIARDLARGDAGIAHEARVALAGWRLRSIDRLEELEEVRAILLPALALPDALRLIDHMKHIGLFVERAAAAGDHLALFAGAELARDSLGSPRLARRLFTLYADRDRGSPWRAKALMAALELADDAGEREPLTARLDQLADNIYVRASRGAVARPADYAVLEGRLGASLTILRQRIAAEAGSRDVAVLETARALDSIQAAEELRRRIEAGDSTVPRTDSILPPDTLPRRDTLSRRDTLPRAGVARASDPSPGPGWPAEESEAGAT